MLRIFAGPLKSMTELEDRFLRSHNDIRRRYDLPDLVWDDDIARYAQRWADYLRDSNMCKMMHRSVAGKMEGMQYGENLAWNWTNQSYPAGAFVQSPEFAVLGWSQECKDYDYQVTPAHQANNAATSHRWYGKIAIG